MVRCIVLAILPVCLAMRPDQQLKANTLEALVSKAIPPAWNPTSMLAELSKTTSGARNNATFLAAEGMFKRLERNATEHLSDDEIATLDEVLLIIEQSLFAELDAAHSRDQAALNAAEGEIKTLDSDLAHALGDTGSMGQLLQLAISAQDEYTSHHNDLGIKQAAHETEKAAVESALTNFAACSGVPSVKTAAGIDAWKPFLVELDAQRASTQKAIADFETAKAAFENADRTTDETNVKKDTTYCAWKTTFTTECSEFETKIEERTAAFNEAKEKALADAENRKTIFVAGTHVLAHIKFLLGKGPASDETADVETSQFDLAIPVPPEKNECDLTEITHNRWSPQPTCDVASPGKPAETGPTPYTGPAVYNSWGTHMENGVCQQPGFVAITDQAECKQAASDLGAAYSEGSWASNHNGPCFAEGEMARVYWNAATGALSDHGCPVCKKKFVA